VTVDSQGYPTDLEVVGVHHLPRRQQSWRHENVVTPIGHRDDPDHGGDRCRDQNESDEQSGIDCTTTTRRGR
jgi:hypothetical protein